MKLKSEQCTKAGIIEKEETMTRNLTTEEAKEIGRKGGKSKSEKKQASSRENGKKGGRPKKGGKV